MMKPGAMNMQFVTGFGAFTMLPAGSGARLTEEKQVGKLWNEQPSLG